MLIHLFRNCVPADRRRLQRYLALPRQQRAGTETAWLYDLMLQHRSIDYARRAARQLTGAALFEGLNAFRDVPDSEGKRFILEMVLYVVNRDR
jgi:geranylgeranyl diphosphate synthase type II